MTPQLKKNYSTLLPKIGFFSPLAGVGTDCGYGYAAVELITAWQRHGVPVWSFDREAPVVFNFGQPHFYERVEGKLNIGYTPWESSKVPESWLLYMSQMDEIWTTCQLNKEWYEDAGLTVPVKVLHHGVNPNHYPPVKRTVPEDGVVKFLHIGEPSPRKGGATAFRVFKETFGDRGDVHLTLKGRPRFKVDEPNVSVIADKLSQEEMSELYQDHHALIYPTNGEGFGFIPFQGAASGMPTFVTNWSGPEDYMRYCWPIRVEELVEPDYEPHEGLWAKPSDTSLSLWMGSIAARQDRYFDIAHKKALALHADWSWDKIGQDALEMMISSLNGLPS